MENLLRSTLLIALVVIAICFAIDKQLENERLRKNYFKVIDEWFKYNPYIERRNDTIEFKNFCFSEKEFKNDLKRLESRLKK